MVFIRSYRPTDLDAVIAIFLAAVRQVAARDYAPAQIDAWARLDRDSWVSRRRGRATWVAVIGRSPVGFTDLEPNGHLDMLYVHPAHQRVGIASALLATAEAAAQGQGLSRIFAEASITARSFFDRRGFRLVAEQTVERRGQTLMNFKMEKRLT
jgi:putative acetyltransferase